MLIIWKNFVTGRNKLALTLLIVFGLTQIFIAFIYNPWWLFGPLSIFGWAVLLPHAIYLIDLDTKRNPGRPKTLGNLGRILFGR